MKFLHTSDWHLGRSLYGRKRYGEFGAFLDWLVKLVNERSIDCLLVAGDVFDTPAPSNRAQALYYRFLHRIAASSCGHVIIIGGNHDSPTFLNAPRQLLRSLDVHVIGAMPDDPREEVIVLKNHRGEAEAVVCAVPYLRDRDIRSSRAGETVAEKNTRLLDGLRTHYDTVCQLAAQRRPAEKTIPLVAMGHLFTSGATTVEDDGVRELYVGSLLRLEAGAFPETIDYLALGHLHTAQKVAGREHMRYCGSPLPMGFGEASRKKVVIEVEFRDNIPRIDEIAVPCFKHLLRIRGTLDDIDKAIAALGEREENIWLEIEYEGMEGTGTIRERLEEMIDNTPLEILRVKNRRLTEAVLRRGNAGETLDDLDVFDVFDRLLDAHDVKGHERDSLVAAYREIVTSLNEADDNAE